MTFQLDTSGFVSLNLDGKVPKDWMDGTAWTFASLTPFAQGYVEAAFREFFDGLTDENRAGVMPCKCGSHPTPSDDGARPDDGKRSMWCQSCLQHVHGWERTESEAIEAWNGARLVEIVAAIRYDRLAPETLARIIADCEHGGGGLRDDADGGRDFWTLRQAGALRNTPPLTVQLGDDGKVRFAS